jgi:uncharacterized protein YjbI with pentapeptide repeats
LSEPFEFDFAISFADEDREFAKSLVRQLQEERARIFYDDDYKSINLGKNLQKEFKKIYSKKTIYLIVVISKYYPLKEWSQFEFEVGKKEARRRKSEFILPIRLDSTEIVGIPNKVAYLDLRKRRNIPEAARVLMSKLKQTPNVQSPTNDSITKDYFKRRNYLIDLITGEKVNIFNDFRRDENFAPLDLRQINVGGYWNIDGKKRSLILEGIVLKNSNLAQSDLALVKIKGSDLSNSSLYLGNMSKMAITDTNLSHLFLQQCDIYDANIKDCNLYHTNLSIANLFETHFNHCNLYETNFSFAKCNNSTFFQCLIYNPNFLNTNLFESKFRQSVLIDCTYFNGLICQNADFSDTIINSTGFVKYLRENGALNVPEPITGIEDIRAKMIDLNYPDQIMNSICDRLASRIS